MHVPITSATREGAAEGRTNTVALEVRVRSASLEFNDHNHADTLTITAEWKDTGVDPRFLKNGTGEFWLGEADDDGGFTRTEENLRFLGVVNRVKRMAKEGAGLSVEIEFHDYTALFLQQKPFSSAGVPAYSDTLSDAWKQICDHTGPFGPDGKVLSSVEVLRDRLEFRGQLAGKDIGDLTIGQAVSARFAKLAKVAVKPNSDAWAVWSQTVGSLGLITFIDRDKCVVTTSTEHYTSETAPKMVWGLNIAEIEESTASTFSDKGVAITSFDPLTGTTIEAFYPPPNDERINRKHIRAARKHSAPPTPPSNSDRYDFFEYNGVTNPDVLAGIAERVWDERSRQELEGSLKTYEMYAYSDSKSYDPANRSGRIDLLDLRAGDVVKVEIDPTDSGALTSITDEGTRVRYLVNRGYSEDMAKLVARNAPAFESLERTYHAKRVQVTFEVEEDGGKFEVHVTFHNRIKVKP
jgi:hypothetical protein